jgi:hypothetical protein
MKPEAQRIAIAKAYGFEDVHEGVHPTNQWRNCLLGIKTGKELHEQVPDYLQDLNAIHEAEKTLSREEHRSFRLNLIAVVADTTTDDEPRSIVSATAAQRAEAFLKTLNL